MSKFFLWWFVRGGLYRIFGTKGPKTSLKPDMMMNWHVFVGTLLLSLANEYSTKFQSNICVFDPQKKWQNANGLGIFFNNKLMIYNLIRCVCVLFVSNTRNESEICSFFVDVWFVYNIISSLINKSKLDLQNNSGFVLSVGKWWEWQQTETISQIEDLPNLEVKPITSERETETDR